jgi:hypothetical protein
VLLESDEQAVRGLIARARVGLRAHREASELPCAAARMAIATEPDGRRHNRTIRRHLRGCASCRAYRKALRGDARALRAIAPVDVGGVAGSGVLATGLAAKAGLVGIGLTQVTAACAVSVCAVGGIVFLYPRHRVAVAPATARHARVAPRRRIDPVRSVLPEGVIATPASGGAGHSGPRDVAPAMAGTGSAVMRSAGVRPSGMRSSSTSPWRRHRYAIQRHGRHVTPGGGGPGGGTSAPPNSSLPSTTQPGAGGGDAAAGTATGSVAPPTAHGHEWIPPVAAGGSDGPDSASSTGRGRGVGGPHSRVQDNTDGPRRDGAAGHHVSDSLAGKPATVPGAGWERAGGSTRARGSSHDGTLTGGRGSRPGRGGEATDPSSSDPAPESGHLGPHRGPGDARTGEGTAGTGAPISTASASDARASAPAVSACGSWSCPTPALRATPDPTVAGSSPTQQPAASDSPAGSGA